MIDSFDANDEERDCYYNINDVLHRQQNSSQKGKNLSSTLFRGTK